MERPASPEKLFRKFCDEFPNACAGKTWSSNVRYCTHLIFKLNFIKTFILFHLKPFYFFTCTSHWPVYHNSSRLLYWLAKKMFDDDDFHHFASWRAGREPKELLPHLGDELPLPIVRL
jgi:hypothetical protein